MKSGLGEKIKIGRILYREYFMDLERNAYSGRIIAITHRLESAVLPAPAFFESPRVVSGQG
jgi:hypothetical protein